MFRLALNAGHGFNTKGKRCLKAIDPNETREYVLNKRICDKIEQRLSAYREIEILRIDDGSEMPISARAARANAFKADFYLAIHHNAGINGGSGGGVEAYVYLKTDEKTRLWQSRLYEAVIEKTKLSGNRAQPLRSADLGECRQTAMPAVLLECGFIDSTADTPVILTDTFADGVAAACIEVIAELAGIALKNEGTAAVKSVSDTAQEVIAGRWGNGAERKSRLAAAGYDVAAVQSAVNRILSGEKPKSDDDIAREVIAGKWGNGAERKARLTAAGYDAASVQKKVNEMLK